MKSISKSIKRLLPNSVSGIFANFGWLAGGRIIQMAISIFVVAWLARYLGPERFGIFSFGIAFVALFSAFAGLGLHGVVVKDIVKDQDRKETILGTTFVLRLFGGIFSIFLVFLLISITEPNDQLVRIIVVLISLRLVFGAFSTIDLWFQSLVESKYVVIVRTSSVLIGLGLRLLLIYIGAHLLLFAAIIPLEALLFTIGLLIIYKRRGFLISRWRFSWTEAKRLISRSWPLILSGIGVVIYLKIDQIMLRQMIDDQENGIYAAAVRLSEFWYFVPTFIAISVFPTLIRSKTRGTKIYKNRFQQLLDVLALLSISVAILITFLSKDIVNVLYGTEYQGTAPVLSIHIWAAIFAFWGQALSKWLINEDLLVFSPIRHTLGAIVNVGLNLLLIPLYGAIGAAIATVVSYATASYLVCFLHPQTRPVGKMMTLAFFAPIRMPISLVQKFRSDKRVDERATS